MKWYLVKLVFSIETEGGPVGQGQPAQFDEQLRLVEGASGGDAYSKAIRLGESQDSLFGGADGRRVRWRFINVSEVIRIDELYDGVEIYSGTVETSEKQRFINSVLQRSGELLAAHPFA